MHTARTARAGMVFIALAGLLWAALESLGVALIDSQHPLQVVEFRYATHLSIMLALFLPRRGVALVHTSRLRLQIARGLLMLLMPLCFLAALAVADSAEVISVFWVVPLLTMALSGWILRERSSLWFWMVAAAGWAGVLLIERPGSDAIGPGTAPALGMALCLSLYLVLTRLLRDESTATNLVFTAVCVLLPLGVVVPIVWDMPTVGTLMIMAAIGLLGLGALYFFDIALEIAPASTVVPMLYAQPLWTLLIAVSAGSATLGTTSLIGSVVIAAACAILLLGVWRIPASITATPVPDVVSVSPDASGFHRLRRRS